MSQTESNPEKISVLIVGGGLAGLAAASALSQQNFKVTLIDSRPRLGGRATSFVDPTTGEEIDNCQHVSMACCTNFQHLCETAGIHNELVTEDELTFIAPDGQHNKFRASPWSPMPFHLAGSMSRLSYLSKATQKAIRSALLKLFKTDFSSDEKLRTTSFLDWLKSQNQPEEAIRRFWELVLVSALSESLDRIDITHAKKIFFDGFVRHRDSWKVQVPKVPLSKLYGSKLRSWLEQQGVQILLKTGAEEFVVENEKIKSVQLRDGNDLKADHFVLAVPLGVAQTMMPESIRSHSQYNGLNDIEASPISSVHLWFDRPITELRHAVLIDRMSQWVFNRNAILEAEKTTDRYAYQIVISASRELKDLSQEQIQERVLQELAECFTEAKHARLLHARVITEHKAVFSVKPGIEELRSDQQSPISNLQIAGDWTNTGWPATMEGAVRSGYLAAENVIGQIGKKRSFLQADLPVAMMTRLLLGNVKTV